MGKNKVRLSSSKKRQRWAKGKSSSSNPSGTKHREAAKSKMLKSGFFGGAGKPETARDMFQGGPAKLTAESLLKHDAVLGNAADVSNEGNDDAMTLGQTAKTFDTFASDWTQCTNVSFGKLTNRFKPNNPQHR